MRLPFPAAGLSPAAVPREYWARPAGREGPFAPNTLLQRATRLFKGKVVGSGARWEAACWGQGGRPGCVPGVVGWEPALPASAAHARSGGHALAQGQIKRARRPAHWR